MIIFKNIFMYFLLEPKSTKKSKFSYSYFSLDGKVPTTSEPGAFGEDQGFFICSFCLTKKNQKVNACKEP
jgi:hypothetical protein